MLESAPKEKYVFLSALIAWPSVFFGVVAPFEQAEILEV